MKNSQTIYTLLPRFVSYIFIFSFFNIPSVNAQKRIKIGYSIGSFKQKNYFTESSFNAQSLNLSYEKGIKAKSWSFGLTFDYLEATTFYDSENGITYKFDDQYFSLEPNWKYYFGQKTNSAYLGFGLPFTASKYDLLSGVSAKLGFQKQFSDKFSAHIGANYSLQMPIDDPGPIRRLNAEFQLAYHFPYTQAMEKIETEERNQRKNNFKTKKLLKFGIGSHLLFVDGPIGGNINATLEKSFSTHWSMTVNAELAGNGQECCEPEQMKNLNQFRLILQPDVRYYPNKSLSGFYLGTGLGLVGGYDKPTNIFTVNNEYRSFAEVLFDLKFGYQQQITKNHVLNFFLSPGLLGNIAEQELTPFFRAGLQFGIKK